MDLRNVGSMAVAVKTLPVAPFAEKESWNWRSKRSQQNTTPWVGKTVFKIKDPNRKLRFSDKVRVYQVPMDKCIKLIRKPRQFSVCYLDERSCPKSSKDDREYAKNVALELANVVQASLRGESVDCDYECEDETSLTCECCENFGRAAELACPRVSRPYGLAGVSEEAEEEPAPEVEHPDPEVEAAAKAVEDKVHIRELPNKAAKFDRPSEIAIRDATEAPRLEDQDCEWDPDAPESWPDTKGEGEGIAAKMTKHDPTRTFLAASRESIYQSAATELGINITELCSADLRKWVKLRKKHGFHGSADKFDNVDEYALKSLKAGRSRRMCCVDDCLVNAYLPSAGRSWEQRTLGYGSRAGNRGDANSLARLTFFTASADDMVAANLIAQHKDPLFAIEWLGTFLNTSDFIKVCTSTFTGDVAIPDPKERDLTEWVQTLLSNQLPHAERFVQEKEKDKERARAAQPKTATAPYRAEKGRGKGQSSSRYWDDRSWSDNYWGRGKAKSQPVASWLFPYKHAHDLSKCIHLLFSVGKAKPQPDAMAEVEELAEHLRSAVKRLSKSHAREIEDAKKVECLTEKVASWQSEHAAALERIASLEAKGNEDLRSLAYWKSEHAKAVAEARDASQAAEREKAAMLRRHCLSIQDLRREQARLNDQAVPLGQRRRAAAVPLSSLRGPGAPQFGGTAASVISQVWLWGFGLKVSKIINLSPES
ncbi:unnamed protein product [Symbiodinium natans]|uniref:Uncharacterized protein n=1 Tax=Symbiodinium natans TaxID=878477 RepID=A0A812UW78_9DINO|nr:unnamed protein product [Symbiodinium natans]